MADNQTPKRPNYFDSQFLVLGDFQDEQNYHREMLRRHNRGLHGWGVVRDGLRITPSTDKTGLLISPGSAVDSSGQEIVLDGAGVLYFQNSDRQLKWNANALAYELSAKDVSAAAGVIGTPLDIYLTLTFQESKSTDPKDQYPPPGGTVDVTRMRQTPLLKVEKTPPDDGSSIKLARVNVDVGGNLSTPDMSVRPQMGCLGPLYLKTADGKPQLGIDYDSQSDALRIRARTKDAPTLDATHLTIQRGTGSVGIGTPTPKALLDVFGGGVKIGAASDAVPAAGRELVLSPVSGTSAGIAFQHNNVDTVFLKSDGSTRQTTFGANAGTFLAIDNASGKVGIGATDITHQLTIENKTADASMRLKSSIGGGNFGLLITSGQNGAYLATAQPLSLNSGATGIKLLATGNVGIGTGSVDPTQRLDVRSSGPDVGMNLRVANSDLTNFLSFFPGRTGDQNPAIMWPTGKPLRFATADSTANGGASGFAERVRISGDGNVGIGTTQPLAKLEIQSGADNNGANDQKAIALSYRGGGFRHWIRTRHNSTLGQGNAIDFYVNNSTTANGSTAPGTGTLHVMTLDSGRVSIGMDKPDSNLHLNVPASSQPISAMSIDVQSFHTIPNLVASHFFRVRDIGANQTRFYIRGDGNVGIGTTNPGAMLEVAGDVKVIGRITVGDWALESRTTEQFGKGALFIMYKGADVARFGAKQDMFQVFKLDNNGNRTDKRYWYINHDEGIGWGTAP